MKRRTLLIHSATTLGLAAAGSVAFVYEDSYTFIPGLLQRLVGDFHMARQHEQQFVEALARHYGARKLAALIGLYKIRSATGLGTTYTNAKLDRFERMLVTDFLTATDYLGKQHEPNPKVSFIGYRLPCRNPFATFSGLA